MSEVTAQAFAGMGPLQLLAWYRQHKDDLTHLGSIYEEYQAITDPPDTEVGLKKRVELGFEAANIFAAMSGSTTAADIIKTIDEIVDNDALLGIAAKLLSPLIHPAPASPASPGVTIKPLSVEQLSVHKEDVEALGFDFAKLANLVELVGQILAFFKGAK